MSPKLKTAFVFGICMSFVFCTMSIISILKREEETRIEIIQSFGAALAAGLVTGVLAYFFSDKLNFEKLFGKKQNGPKQ